LNPTSSVVSRTTTSESVVYQWDYPDTQAIRRIGNALIAVWLISIFVSLTTSAFFIFSQTKNSPPVFFIVGWAVLSIIGIAVTVAAIYYVGRRSSPEILTLRNSCFSYDSGICPPILHVVHLNLFDCASPFVLIDSMIRRHQIVGLSKDSTNGFVLDRTGYRQRLYFNTELGRIEIGRFLSVSDREWLYRAIDEWEKT
jgi:hypothetical protein